MSQHPSTRRKTVTDLAKAKGGTPLVCLTAYDAPTAALIDPLVDFILVGDSLGMVVHGLPSTVGVTVDMMILHGKAVMRGSHTAFVAVDMPFGSYESSPQIAFANATRIMCETGCQAVKIESGAYVAETIAFLTARGVPVIGHVGLRPQAIHVDGGFKAKGKTDAEWAHVIEDAIATDEAGAVAMVVEGVAEPLAREITQAVTCPTIGIGASSTCDGQILVTPDMLGVFERVPRFVRKFANIGPDTTNAVEIYAKAVRARSFPNTNETYLNKG